MVRKQLADWPWVKVAVFLAADRGAGRPAKNDRNFIEAVLWWRRTGVPWRDLPSEFGPWKTVFSRFDRWSRKGKWQRLFAALRTDADTEWHSIDSTIHRAHQHAAGAKGGARCRRSAGRVAACRRRCISSSMHSGYRSPSRSPRVNATTISGRRRSSLGSCRGACSGTRATIRTPFEPSCRRSAA